MQDDPSEIANPYESPSGNDSTSEEGVAAPRRGYLTKKQVVLVGLLVVAAISGFLSGMFPLDRSSERALNFIAGIAIGILVVRWCHLDRLERGLPRWRFFPLLVVICPGPLVMVPIYFLRTRGWRGGIAILQSLAFLALMAGVAGLASFLGLLLSGDFDSF